MSIPDLIIINEIIIVLINATGFWLSFLVYFADKKAKLNQYLPLFFISMILWIDFYFLAVFSRFLIPQYFSLQFALFSAKMVAALSGSVLIFFYLFALYFPVESKRNYFFDKIYLSVWLIFSFLSLETNLIFKKMEFEGFLIKISGGELIDFFLLTAMASIFLILFVSFKKYPLLSQEEKSKTKYFFVGMAILALFQIIFNVVIPVSRGGVFKGDTPFDSFFHLLGGYSVFLFNSLAAYAILNKKLFNIRVLLTQLLVVVMGILLLITPFLVNIPWLKTLLSMVFLLFCVFGWLLVRSSIREVRQKEILEQTVEERTKELRASKHELELNKIELEKKVAELEKWYKLTVGRELRMVELKQKIKELEGEVKKK